MHVCASPGIADPPEAFPIHVVTDTLVDSSDPQ